MKRRFKKFQASPFITFPRKMIIFLIEEKHPSEVNGYRNSKVQSFPYDSIKGLMYPKSTVNRILGTYMMYEQTDDI